MVVWTEPGSQSSWRAVCSSREDSFRAKKSGAGAVGKGYGLVRMGITNAFVWGGGRGRAVWEFLSLPAVHM
jgi:hypothetical protein